uniref:Protein-tyrosine-phosphatase n=1 Tax=Hucho hucho TaxID=62062 RepID=A0A4W5QLC0_9TELE
MNVVPSAMILVEAGVYIGAASDLKDAQDLTNAGITHILTVDSEQPASPDGPFRMMYVHVLDKSSTDLLSHLKALYLMLARHQNLFL